MLIFHPKFEGLTKNNSIEIGVFITSGSSGNSINYRPEDLKQSTTAIVKLKGIEI